MKFSTIVFVLLALVVLSVTSKPSLKINNMDKGNRRLIKFSERLQLWLTPKQVDELGKDREVNFMDITDHQTVPATKITGLADIPRELKLQAVVKPIAAKASKSEIVKTVTDLSAYFNRFYTTETGEKSALYLKERFDKYIAEIPEPRRSLFKSQLFTHSWRQPSVVVRMEGKNPALKDQIVVIGGHLDSTAGGASRKAPGADDDASGSATVMEIFRLIAQSDFTPDRSIDFMLYAAEEVGLRGSAAIASKYKSEGKKVHAVGQFDMVGYLTRSTVGIVTDFTSAPLNTFLRLCIDEYSVLKYGDIRCGYACSDHASWHRNGYRAVFPFEAYPFSNINRRIHTANDLIEHLNMDEALEFSKFGVGFAMELSVE